MKNPLHLHLTIAASLLVLLIAVLLLLWPSDPREREPLKVEEARVRRLVPYPILLLHGLGGQGKGWVDSGLDGYLEQKGLRYGGTVKLSKSGGAGIEGGSVEPELADFFHLEMSDPFEALDDWVKELGKDIGEVRARTGAPRVVLVGFSAGGLAGRKYVVEHPEDHGVARFVTLASPHRGSEWAYAVLVHDKLIEAKANGGLRGFVAGPLLSALGALEEKVGIPLDRELLRDLLPEKHNEALAALNRRAHPSNLEYACIRAVGTPSFRGWEEVEAEIVHLRNGELLDSRLAQKLATALLAGASFLSGQPSLQGDGAVLLSSQDLHEIEYFRRHPELADELIEETSTVDVAHLDAKGRYRAVLEAIDSEVRFLTAETVPDSAHSSLRVSLDFQDYLGGVLDVEARNPYTEGRVPVTRPVIYQRGEEAFARVVIGPFDSERVPVVEVRVRSLAQRQGIGKAEDTALVYGKRLILAGEALPSQSSDAKSGSLEVTAIRGVPEHHSSGTPWDSDGSPPDLRLVWFVGQEEKLRSEVISDVRGAARLDQRFESDLDLQEERVTLEVWDADLAGPELVGRFIWNPGELHSGTWTEVADDGLALDLEVVVSEREQVLWEPEPLYLLE